MAASTAWRRWQRARRGQFAHAQSDANAANACALACEYARIRFVRVIGLGHQLGLLEGRGRE